MEAAGDYYAVLSKSTRMTMPSGAKVKVTGTCSLSRPTAAGIGRSWKGGTRRVLLTVFPKLPNDLTISANSIPMPDE